MEIYKIKQKTKQNNDSITAGSGKFTKILFVLFFSFTWEQKVLKFGRTASQWKIKPKIYKHYRVILTEMVQVTYWKIFSLKKKETRQTYVCMKGCKNSVVDTSGHKHRECIVWTKSIITIRAKIVDQQAHFLTLHKQTSRWPASTAVKSRRHTFQVVSPNKKKKWFQATLALKAKYIRENLWWKGFMHQNRKLWAISLLDAVGPNTTCPSLNSHRFDAAQTIQRQSHNAASQRAMICKANSTILASSCQLQHFGTFWFFLSVRSAEAGDNITPPCCTDLWVDM